MHEPGGVNPDALAYPAHGHDAGGPAAAGLPTAGPLAAGMPPLGEMLGLLASVLLALSLLVVPWHRIDLRLAGDEAVECTAVECVNLGPAVVAGLAAVATAACAMALLAHRRPSAGRRLVGAVAVVTSLVALGALGFKLVRETEYLGPGVPVAFGLGALALLGVVLTLVVPLPGVEAAGDAEVGEPWSWDQQPPAGGPGDDPWQMPDAPPMAAPDTPAPGWWLASDGRWYPPEQHPGG